MLARFLLALLIASMLTTVGHAKKVALVVGIDQYDHLPSSMQLQKAVNDARAVASTLSGIGFAVTRLENSTRLEFTRAWQRVLNQLEANDTATVFFAGHGVEIGGLNYLLPRDVPKVGDREEKVLRDSSVSFNRLMEDLRDKRVRISLFIIDACRDNPFRDSRGRSTGEPRGLARVEPAKGSFVMYSAGAGETALDRLGGGDTNPNSVFTRALLPLMQQPGQTIRAIAGSVRTQVLALSRSVGHEQMPAYYDQLEGDLFFIEGEARPGAAPPPASAAPAPATPPSPDRTDERLFWQSIINSSNAELFHEYIRRFPDGVFVVIARQRLADLEGVARDRDESRRRAEEERRRQLEEDERRKRAEDERGGTRGIGLRQRILDFIEHEYFAALSSLSRDRLTAIYTERVDIANDGAYPRSRLVSDHVSFGQGKSTTRDLAGVPGSLSIRQSGDSYHVSFLHAFRTHNHRTGTAMCDNNRRIELTLVESDSSFRISRVRFSQGSHRC